MTIITEWTRGAETIPLPAPVLIQEDGCWRLLRRQPPHTPLRIKSNGYVEFSCKGRMVWAHRFMYELLVAPIPRDMHSDHLCRNPPCCNPAHIEPVPPKVNYLRGVSPFAQNARKTACDKGHLFTEENTYLAPRDEGGRACKRCRYETLLAWRKEHRDLYNARQRAWRAANPEKVREYKLRHKNKSSLLSRMS